MTQTTQTDETPTYTTEDRVTVSQGDLVYDYYSMEPVLVGRPSGSDGWFDTLSPTTGTRSKSGMLDGSRICTMETARRRGFAGSDYTHPTPNTQEDRMTTTPKTEPTPAPTFEWTETPSKLLGEYLKDQVSKDLDAPHRGLPYITQDDVLRVRPTSWVEWLTARGINPPKRAALAVLKDAGLVQKSTTLPAVEGQPKGKALGLYTGPAPRGTASLPRYAPPARTAKPRTTTATEEETTTTGQDISQAQASTLQVGDVIGTTRTDSRKTIAEGSGKTIAGITADATGSRVQARDEYGKIIRSCEPTTKVWRGRTVVKSERAKVTETSGAIAQEDADQGPAN